MKQNHLKGNLVVSNTNVRNPKIIKLNNGKKVVAWEDISGSKSQVKIQELDINNQVLENYTVGPSNKNSKLGDLLNYDGNKYIVAWMQQDHDEYRGYVRGYHDGAHTGDYKKLDSSNDYDVENISLAKIGGKDFVAVWNTRRNTGSTKYTIRGEIFELENNGDIDDEKTLSLESSEHDIQDQVSVASFSNNRFIVTWRENKGNNEIRSEVFESDGDSAGSDTEVNFGTENYNFPSVATIGNSAAIAYFREQGTKQILVRKISSSDNFQTISIVVDNINDITEVKITSVNNKYIIHATNSQNQLYLWVYDEQLHFEQKECILISNVSSNNYKIIAKDVNTVSVIWSDGQNVFTVDRALEKICESTFTGSKTDSETTSLTISSTISDTKSKSITSTETHTVSRYKPGTETPSGTKSVSQSNSASKSDTITESATETTSLSESASESKTHTLSRYKPGTETLSGTGSSSESRTSSSSASLTGSVSKTSSSSVSSSASTTETNSQTKSITNSNTQSESSSSSQSLSESNTNSLPLTDSLEVSGTNSITPKCGKDVHGIFKDKILLDVRVDNIRVTNVDTSSPSLYTQHTTQRHSNSGRSNINEQIKLSLKDNSKDYIDNLQERVINSDYIINGTVSYSNNVLNTELVHSNPNIIQTERVNCQRDDYTSYDLLHTNLRYYGINKCEYNVINDQKDIILRPNECSITSMTATFNKNVKVSYDADFIISARNKFSGKAADDELKVIGECLLLPNINWQFVNDGKQIKAPISGIITHSALQSINFDRADCATQLSYVDANLVYKDFQLTAPTDLTPFVVRYSNSKDYVNTNRYGDLNVNAYLSLNIPLTGETEGFSRDVTSTQFIKSGKVTYLNENAVNALVYRHGDISGYQVKDSKPLEYDIFSLAKKIPTHALVSWDSVRVNDNINLSVVPNGCKKAVIEAFVYKDVPLSYNARGYLGLKDENGRVISGTNLESSASDILSNQFTIERQEAVFGISGTMTHNIIKNFTVYTEDCTSKHQSTTALPEVIVSLTYSDYVFTLPSASDFNQKLKKYISGQSLSNNKKYGTTKATSSPKLEVKLSKSLNSHYEDIKQNDLVKDGTVQYIRNFNDIQNLHNNDRSGYKLDTMGDVITQSWFSSQYKVSSGLTSAWNKLNAEATFSENIVPGQCVDVKLVASVYEGVRVEYAAKGYFTAKTLDGRSVQGEELLNVAQMVIDKEDITLNSNGEAVFNTEGFLEHSFVAGVISNSSDCVLV